MSRFKFRSFDLQRSRNVIFSVIAWPYATLELTGCALESDHDEFTLLNTLTGHTTELTRRGTPGVWFEYRKGLESIFVDWTHPIVTDRTHHHVRSTPRVMLSLWAPDRMRRWQILALLPVHLPVELTGRASRVRTSVRSPSDFLSPPFLRLRRSRK
jgi:hypothetical protein